MIVRFHRHLVLIVGADFYRGPRSWAIKLLFADRGRFRRPYELGFRLTAEFGFFRSHDGGWHFYRSLITIPAWLDAQAASNIGGDHGQ